MLSMFQLVRMMKEVEVQDLRVIKESIKDYNPIMHLIMLVVCESKLIDNQLDLAIWIYQIIFCTIMRLTLEVIANHLKTNVLQNINATRLQLTYQSITKVKLVTALIFLLLLLHSIINYLLFNNCSPFYLEKYMFTNIILYFSIFKIFIVFMTLDPSMKFYLHNNIDQIDH